MTIDMTFEKREVLIREEERENTERERKRAEAEKQRADKAEADLKAARECINELERALANKGKCNDLR